MLAEADAEIVRLNRTISGLPHLLDTELMQSILIDHGLLDPTDSLAVDYLRFKPGENCIVRLVCEHGDRSVFGYAKAHGQSAAQKLKKSAERTHLTSELGIGRVQIPELGMEINFLPNDNALASLGRMGSAVDRDAMLQRIFKKGPNWSGASCEVLSYKPERRLTAALSHPENGRVVAKFTTRQRYERSRHVHKRLVKVDGVGMPSLAGWSRSCNAMAMQWISGESLTSAVGRGDTMCCSGAGRALARFHQSANKGFKTSEQRRNTGDLTRLADDLSMISPGQTERARTLALAFEQWWLQQEARSTPVHGDFNFEQVVVSQKGAAMIDFDEVRMGHPMEDLGSFIARMELHTLDGSISPTAAAELVSAFMEGYQSEIDMRVDGGLKRFIAVALFRLLHHPFRVRKENWPEVISALLERCDLIWREARAGEEELTGC